MKKAKFTADRAYTIGEVDRRLFGSFAEHLGRTIYNGIFEPGHLLADEQGFRKDVIQYVKEANITVVRYPGGNFVSGYQWTDGIGPLEDRPKKLELAWSTIESNRIGIDEFADWCKKANVELMATVNLGTGLTREAGNMLEYCNFPAGTYWSDLRRKNGHINPHNIKLWCLGNEMDGEWQIGALPPLEYARKALETARIMKKIDRSVEIIACGSCCCETPTYPEWNRIVLENTYDDIDYLSLHRYYTYDQMHKLAYPTPDDHSDAPFFAVDLQEFLHTVISAADYVKTKNRSAKKINICFDEWNVISNTNPPAIEKEPWQDTTHGGVEIFNMLDALICGSLLCTFVKNADRVKISCQSLLVNTGGMFYTDIGGSIVKNTTFYPFADVARYAKGVSILDRIQDCGVVTNHHGVVPALQSATVYDEENGALNIFVVNFDSDDITLSMDLRSFDNITTKEHTVLKSGNLFDTNTFENPLNVKPQQGELPKGNNGCFETVLPKHSWNVLRFSC